MSESHSSSSVRNSAREDAAPTNLTFVAKLQQAADLANKNCDRATALAHKQQLREAQSRINQLEADRSGWACRAGAGKGRNRRRQAEVRRQRRRTVAGTDPSGD
jgi:uncharacterized caspase-like protein